MKVPIMVVTPLGTSIMELVHDDDMDMKGLYKRICITQGLHMPSHTMTIDGEQPAARMLALNVLSKGDTVVVEERN